MASYQLPKRVPGWKWIAVFLAGVAITLGISYMLKTWIFSNRTTGHELTAEDIPSFNPIAGTNLVHNLPNAASMVLQKGTPKIDGNLQDWNLSGANSFHVSLDPTRIYPLSTTANPSTPANNPEIIKLVRDYYSAQGAMMEDASCLYIAARIGDPKRILIENDMPPKTENLDEETPSLGSASYLQIRFSVEGGTTSTAITNKRDIQLLLRRSSSKDRTYLTILGGIPSNRTTLHPKTVVSGNEGFECVFKQVAHECIIEAKIPWELLPVKPAADATEFRCLWQIIRQFGNKRIRLVEIADSSGSANLAADAGLLDTTGKSFWGKVVRQK